MPVFSSLFLIFILANTGIPLSLNWLGEQLSLLGIFERNPIISALGATSIFLSACYSLWFYNRLSFGSYSPYLKPLSDLNRREFHLLIALLIPTFLFGIFPNVILDNSHFAGSLATGRPARPWQIYYMILTPPFSPLNNVSTILCFL